MNTKTQGETDTDTGVLGRQLSGRWIVGGMFAFAGLLTGAMGLYWHFYTLPFRELQNAIAEEFEGSSPRAIGGRIKGDSDQPTTLRLVVRCEFNPTLEEELSEERAARLFQLASEHAAMGEYEIFEVHLYQRQPEQETPYWSVSRPVSEWEKSTEG